MKKIVFLSCLLFGMGYCASAQYTHDAVTDFGRLNDVRYDLDDQNVLYAISIDNHIVVSQDNGSSWSNLYNHPDTQVTINGLKTLADGISLSFTVTESSGDTFIQILNSETGAVTAVIGSPVPGLNISVTDYDILGEDGSTVLVYLTHLDSSNQIQHKVYYTDDAGEDWQVVYHHSENEGFVPVKVLIGPVDPSRIFIATGASQSAAGGGGLLKSTDGGQTWSETLQYEIITAAAINPLDPDDIMVSAKAMTPANQKLFRSLNEGQTWTELPMQWNTSGTNVTACIAYNPSVSGKIILADQNEIAYSADNGASWNHTVYEGNVLDATSISPNPFATLEAVVMTGLYPSRTTDGGATLSKVESPFYLTHNVAVRKADGNDNLYYSCAQGYMHKDYATGLTSINNTGPDINSAFRNQIIVDPHIEGLLVHHDFDPQHPDYKSELHISFDHGATKTLLLTLLNSEDSFFPHLMAASSDPGQPEQVYVVLSNGMRCRLYNFDLSDPAAITYETYALPVLSLEFPNNTRILHFDADYMIINVNNEIHRSTDGGATWTDIFTIADATAISSVDSDPFSENRVAIATDNGIYQSEDGGLTWSLLLEGVNSDKVRFSDADEGVLAINLIDPTDQSGTKIMYYNASGWLTVGAQELRHINATGMDFSFVQDRINAYISTTDMGVVRYSFEIGELGTEHPVLGQAGLLLYPNPATDLINVVADAEPGQIAVYH